MELGNTLALATGVIFLLMGAIFVFSSFMIASNFHNEHEESPPSKVALSALVIDFLLVVLDSLPFASLILGIRELPRTAGKMKERWADEPLIRRFLILGICLFVSGGGALWLSQH